ncbi:MAG TPA: four helix bundle protein [Chitinophagaceae bacterium]|jgi:four helix bundle protein|nr:four helix bundle protein [Chitinophagaceae bacterium]
MFIKLNHQSLDVYKAVRELTKEIYFISIKLPGEEKFNMIQQLRRAGLSIKLNLSEGASRRSLVERKRFFEISRGSLIEVDAILETAVDLKYFSVEQLASIGELLNKCFAMLSKMI